jgi:hypothetical protein
VSRSRGVKHRIAWAVMMPLALASACIATRPYATLTGNADPLRTQFNNDAGRVRIVMLVAPT